MKTLTNSLKDRARANGRIAGRAAVTDRDDTLTPDQVEAWFAPGTVDPDESLINACNTRQLALALGLTFGETESRSEAFFAAIEEYNCGYREAAREEVSRV